MPLSVRTRTNMDIFKKGWFTEANSELWSGQAFSLEVKEILYHSKSTYQNILIFQCEAFGKVLALDGVIQLTEKDEFAYHELLSHIPLFSHPNPKSVLIIGGGDGGILREVGKHREVEEIHICEIDECVIKACKEHIPSTAIGFDNPKVHVHICDGAKYVELHKKAFDIIIIDSSDPIGPAKTLFEKTFYYHIKEALKSGGVVASQGMCIWIDIDKDLQYIKEVLKECSNLFPVVNYAYSSIPSNTFCQQGFVLASLNKSTDFRVPLRTVSDEEAEQMNLTYYDSDVHQGCFMWPRFLKKELKSVVNGYGYSSHIGH